MALRATAAILMPCLALLAACAEGGGRPDERMADRFVPSPDAGLDALVPPELDGGAEDGGGADAGPPRLDSGADGARPDAGCTTAAECDDGIACNGIERCEGGRCTAGTAVACDDGIGCTIDVCEEPGTCAFSPRDSACGAGQTCSPSTGCVSGCGESPCRLVPTQCGCPSGQGCFIDGTGSRLCATAGVNGEGAACSGLTSCTPGHLCINIDAAGGSTNVCSQFCNIDADCPGGGLCLITLSDGAGGSIPGVKLCTRGCDPVGQAGCRAGAYCDLFREAAGAMRYFTDCAAPPVGTGGQGAPCADNDDCQAGFGCIGAPGRCLHWCRVSGGSGCSGGTTCFGFTTRVVVDGTEYGVCD